MAVEAEPRVRQSPATLPRLPRVWRVRLARTGRFLGAHVFSSLTRRIVFVNVVGLFVLLSGMLYLNQFRAGLIDARVQSLLTQGEIIAGAVAASAVFANDGIGQDPELLLDLDPGDMPSDEMAMPEFTINPERVAPVLRRLIQPARLRARIYDREGMLVLDSRFLYQRGQIGRTEAAREPNEDTLLQLIWRNLRLAFGDRDLPRYVELGASEGREYPEVAEALGGTKASIVRTHCASVPAIARSTIWGASSPWARSPCTSATAACSVGSPMPDSSRSAETWLKLRRACCRIAASKSSAAASVACPPSPGSACQPKAV